MTRLEQAVRATMMESRGFPAGSLLAVAVSGGPDSLALLYSLHRLRDQLKLRLYGAHLDHGMRGAASDEDRGFVAETFRAMGIGYTVEQADVPAYQRAHRLSPEDAAREVRYRFLARVASEQGAVAVALGHTSDDQAETVLMHIIRGSGLSGIRGMETLSRRLVDGRQCAFTRPLLGISRAETEAYCRSLGLRPRLDESNLSTGPARNRLRLELLPLLEGNNPGVRGALLRLARSAAADLAYLEECVDRVWGEVARWDGATLSLDRTAFLRLPESLRSHVLRRAVEAVKGDLENVEQSHIEGMSRLAGGPVGRGIDLPSGVRFQVGYTEATLGHARREEAASGPLEGERPLEVPGTTLLPGWRVEARLVDPEAGPPGDGGLPDGCHAAVLDCDSLGGRPWVRSRRPGDRVQPLGMSGSKKLQDFMVDSKIPREHRDRVPLVVAPAGIAWVVGWRTAEWARVRPETAVALELRFTRL